MVQLIIFITFVAIALAYYFMQKESIKKEKRREQMRGKRQELLDRTIRSKMDNKQNATTNQDELESL